MFFKPNKEKIRIIKKRQKTKEKPIPAYKHSKIKENFLAWWKHPSLKVLRLPAFILCIVLIIALSIAQLPKNCGNDEQCFQEQAKSCAPAKVTATAEGNKYTYLLQANGKDTCIIIVNLEQTSDKTSPQIKEIIEGKGMVCEVPKEMLQEKYITHIEGLANYCTGPLRESLQAITIENMYDQVVKNLSTVLSDLSGGFTF